MPRSQVPRTLYLGTMAGVFGTQGIRLRALSIPHSALVLHNPHADIKYYAKLYLSKGPYPVKPFNGPCLELGLVQTLNQFGFVFDVG